MTPIPQEPPEEGPDTDDSGGPSYGSSPSLRGWIHPDDRLWRHPSELAVGAARAADSRLAGIRHPRTMILIGAAATVAAIAWALVLLSPASDQPTTSPASDNAANIPLPTLVQSEQVPAPAASAGHSIVALRAVTGHGTVSLVGVAVAEGGLVTTTADELSALHSLWMIGADGRRLRATVLAVDDTSDLALISVPDDIPVAPFADDTTLADGSTDMTLSMDAVSGGTMSLHCQMGAVTGIASTIQIGAAKGMPAITSSVPTTAAATTEQEPGDPLLNRQGAVIGILYQAGATSTYLPTQLVLGVADDLRSTDHVTHGWLGVSGTTAPGSGGARVAALMTGSPAAGLLHPGDVVVAMGAVPIRSMADLRGRLYVSAPDAKVALSVVEGTTTRVVDVTLGASP